MKRAALILAAPILLLTVAAQKPAYVLPAERAVKLPAGNAAELVQGQCAACHSLDYITHQPPKMGQAFWTAEVTKMRTVYGAAIDEADGERIARYLAGAF